MVHTDIATTPEAAPSVALSSLGSPALHEFIRYAIASAAALGVDVAALYLLTAVGMPYLVAGAVAFLAGLSTVYVLSITWVFNTRRMESASLEFLAFAGIGVVGLGINELILFLCVGIFALPLFLGKAASVMFVFSWNFAARKGLLFPARV